MNTLKTTLVSALTLGAMTVTFAGDAFADHKQDRGGRGRGVDYVDVYVDAGHNRELQRLIGEGFAEHNPYVNIVFSKRYADVTVSVNGTLSAPYRGGDHHGRYRAGTIAMDYDYTIKVRSGGRVLLRDRIYGRVTERAGRRRSGGYYNNSYSKEELAKDAFGFLVDVISARRNRSGGYGGRYGFGNRLDHKLTHEAYEEIADYVAHIKIPRKRRRRY